jgi:hypothetical protein
MTRIDRTDPFWRQFFFEGWRQLLSRVAGGHELLQGSTLAQQASGLADDAVREAFELGKPVICAVCDGVGCTHCGFTGRESPAIDVPASPVIDVEPPLPCRACEGTGLVGEMGWDGVVHRPSHPGDHSRDCPKCEGSGSLHG